jgi:group II intron reverse transcriptase/maturase
MLCKKTSILIKVISNGMASNDINVIKHDKSELNTETPEKGIIEKVEKNQLPSVAISIELWIQKETSDIQSLALYLKQDIWRQNGGRIADQAKASGNTLDSGNHKIFRMRFHNLSKFDRLQNSVMLMSMHSYLTIRTVSNHTREKGCKETFRKDKKTFEICWPKKWQKIEREVRKEQMKLCALVKKYGGTDKKEILSYQRKLALSLNFRLWAVKWVTTNKGKKTPGVDGKLINSDEEKCRVVKDLKWWIINPRKYKSMPVKRVYIPKGNNKLRPLGIPNIEERCLQALVTLVLEPLVECKSDTHSYGFRKFRSAKMAIGALRVNLRSNPDHYDKYVLDADIKGFFDNISHDWLLKHIPLEITLKIILEKWLKAGSIYLTKFEPTELGTPQGGIISPCLANFTLNGLQEYIAEKVRKAYKGFKRDRFNVKRKVNGKNKWTPLSLKLFTVRYADDFLVLGRSRRMIIFVVRPAVEEFLKVRGLTLSSEKTKILSVLRGDKIRFLGYCFQYQNKFSPKYNQFNDRLNLNGIACFPEKENYMTKVKEIKDIFRKSQNDTAYTLITKLNPIIRGWANYFNMSQSYYLRNRLVYALYRFVWIWAKRKHPRW